MLISILIVAVLIYMQYTYASKTESMTGLEYIGYVDVEEFDGTSIFNYGDKIVGFKDPKNKSQWLVEGSVYSIKYKNRMWHRDNVMLISFDKID